MNRFRAQRAPDWCGACAGGSAPLLIPLRVSGMQIEQCKALQLPRGVPLHHVCSMADLPSASDGDPLTQLLFPDGTPHDSAVVGFDVEWRPEGRAFRGLGGTTTATQRPPVPVAVLQLSSEHANVVINTVALGRSVLGEAGERAAGAAGVGCARAVLESEALLKVGLQCDEDVRRLQLALPECRFRNVVDIKVGPGRSAILPPCMLAISGCGQRAGANTVLPFLKEENEKNAARARQAMHGCLVRQAAGRTSCPRPARGPLRTGLSA